MKSTFVSVILFLVMLSLQACSLRTIKDIRQPSSIVKRTTDLVGETVLLPAAVPDRVNFTPLGYFTISVDTKLRGILVVYASAKDRQAVTYEELYNEAGKLILIRWVEKSGVTRTTIDSGVLENDALEPIGVLRLVPEGNSTGPEPGESDLRVQF